MRILDIFRRAPAETRAAPAGSYGPLGSAAPYVDARMAETLAAVSAAVDVISSSVASLPVRIYEGDTETEAHPLALLVRNGPNATQSWPDWTAWTMGQALLHGNALSEIVTDGRGRLVELRPIPWTNVSVQLVNGRLVYDVVMMQGQFGGTGRPRRLLASDVFHLRDRSDDGYIGRARLSRVAPVIYAAIAQQTFASNLFENGAMPSGTLSIPGKTGDVAFQRLREQFERKFGGAQNAWRALILQDGMTWKSESATPEDSQLLESRKFSTEEIARTFNIPPPLLQDYSHNTFTNSAAAGRWFAQFTLTPWVRRLEAAFHGSVLTETERATYRVEFDLSGLLRGDDTARWANWKIALDAGVLDPDEIRQAEGWAPRAAPEAMV